MLILGGVVLLGVDRLAPAPRHERGRPAAGGDLVGIGLFQCLALVPGVSRSGATIVGALLLGADKRAAAEFSFFLSMPTMAGAFAYDLYKNRDALELDDCGIIAVGFVAPSLRRWSWCAGSSVSSRGGATRSSAGGESSVGVAALVGALGDWAR